MSTPLDFDSIVKEARERAGDLSDFGDPTWEEAARRLLASLDPDVRARTVVMFVGDNGTPARTAPPDTPGDRAKDSLYQGGVHVPLVVAGAGVVDGDVLAGDHPVLEGRAVLGRCRQR